MTQGNLISDSRYTYDGAGRMVQAQNVTLTLVYTYNADGLRVARDVSGTTTTFVWDWATPVPELVLSVAEGPLHDGENVYLVGLDTVGWWDGEAWSFALPDALGSVRQETDTSGAVVAAREWTPYGTEMGSAQAGPGYTGEWWDGNAGLLYLRARWYDVATGRFTQRDALFGSPVYHYSSDNPINRVDPSGHIDWSACTVNGAYGTCVIEQGDTLYKIARELQGAGVESQAGLSKVVGDIIGYNPAIQGNPNYIKIGDSLTLPAEWISALQTQTSPPMDAVVITLEPLPPYLPPGVLETSCFPGCDEGMPPDPVLLWREPVSTLGEFMGHPAIDNIDTILQTFEHGIRGLEGGLIPQGEVYNFVAQLAKDANVDTCPTNRFARGGFVVIEQVGVTFVATKAGAGLGTLTGTGAAALTGGNLGAFGAGYIVGWAGGYFGSYKVTTTVVEYSNNQWLFPFLEDLLCE